MQAGDGDEKKERQKLGDKNRFGKSTWLSYDPWSIRTQLCFEIKYTACDSSAAGSEQNKHQEFISDISNGISGRHARKGNQIVV